MSRPFLKWAGGKHRMVDRITAVLPKGNRLVEPFVGGASLFLATDYPAYLLGDINQDLIGLYQAVQERGEAFIKYAASFFTHEANNSETYYSLRTRFNLSTDITERSALFLYLNRHGFNGLCRYNSSGEFNVSFGRYKRPYFPYDELRHFHRKAQRATFVCADFTAVMQSLSKGDVVYCDPPYVPLSQTANFTSYSAGSYSLAQQKELAHLAETLSRNKGIPTVISNHNTPFTQHAYRNANIQTFQVQRHISCKGQDRQKAGELLAVFN